MSRVQSLKICFIFGSAVLVNGKLYRLFVCLSIVIQIKIDSCILNVLRPVWLGEEPSTRNLHSAIVEQLSNAEMSLSESTRATIWKEAKSS